MKINSHELLTNMHAWTCSSPDCLANALVLVERDRQVHLLLDLRVCVRLAVVRHLILEDVAHPILIAFPFQVDAQAEQCHDQEAKDYAADDEKEGVLLDEFVKRATVSCIVADRRVVGQELPRIWLVGPRADVAGVVHVGGVGVVIVRLEHLCIRVL